MLDDKSADGNAGRIRYKARLRKEEREKKRRNAEIMISTTDKDRLQKKKRKGTVRIPYRRHRRNAHQANFGAGGQSTG